jgi:hypothetical protein
MFIVLGIQATAKKEQNNTTIKIISIHILQSIDRDSLKQYMNADEKKMKRLKFNVLSRNKKAENYLRSFAKLIINQQVS